MINSKHLNIKQIIQQAEDKGLEVSKNLFYGGWSVVLPNGDIHRASSDLRMVDFVLNY